jgi:hypothetical protein
MTPGRALLCAALCALGAWSPAFADEPAPNPRELGLAEGLLSYCARVDAGAAERIQEQVKSMVQGISADAVARIRGSDEYHQAYDAVTDFVAKVAAPNAKRPCQEWLAKRK